MEKFTDKKNELITKEQQAFVNEQDSVFSHKKRHRKTGTHSVKIIQSIRTKLIFIMIMMMGLALLVFWFLNYKLLSPYYEYSKASQLESSYDDVNAVLSEDEDYTQGGENLATDSQLDLEIIGQNSAVTIYIFRVTNFFGVINYQFDFPSVSDMQKRIIEDLTKNYIYGMDEEVSPNDKGGEGRKLIRRKKSYNIYKVYDDHMGSHYMELFGQTENGSFIYLRTNYQSMNENIDIFNRFIGYAGVCVMILGIFLMIFFGNSFAKPILQITDIAKRMSELDFNVKYPVKTHDEIGVLGSSINTLSETLETTISELKSANNELQKDIEHKIQIDEMRKEFLSNVSHELKTPIALIQGYAEGLLDNINDDEESRDFYCEVIIDEANKMNKMVKKLLTLNQIEFGNNQVTFERFNIVELIQTVMNSAQLLADQKEASMYMIEEYEPVYVWADEYMIEEVVTNYISNAINHVDFEKKIEISLNVMENVVRVSVFNTGQCIPEEDLEKVWIKFYKVDKARTRAYGGSGIGLSIVKATMDSMNRECGVRNRENGVEFWFDLDRQN